MAFPQHNPLKKKKEFASFLLIRNAVLTHGGKFLGCSWKVWESLGKSGLRLRETTACVI